MQERLWYVIGMTKDEVIQLRADKRWVSAVDEWRRHQPDIPGRSEAIRRIVREALATHANAPPPPEPAGPLSAGVRQFLDAKRAS